MKKSALLSLILLICNSSFGQSKKGIEISFIGRYDRHANYVSNFAGRVYNDTIKLYGTNYGVNIIYREKIAKTISAYFGVGYYRLNIDKIKGSNRFVPSVPRSVRNIDYSDDSTRLLYSTSQYYYDNLSITIGLDRMLTIKKDLNFCIGAEVIIYKTFAQKYRLFKGSNYYITHNSKPLELGINLNGGVIKEFRKFYLRPSFIIPVYQILKGDKVFYEDSKMNISKWFNGMGVSFVIGKYL